MPATTGFQFGPNDLTILQHIHALRMATLDHLAALTNRSYKRTQERVAKLEPRGYVKRLTRRPAKLVYGIGREGLAVLIEHGCAPSDLAKRRLRDHELKELGIRHAVFISSIHVRLLQLTPAGSLEISHWAEGPSLWDTVTASNNVRMPIRPDAYFTVAGATRKGKAHFFLEADRGSMSHARMREKIVAYAAYFQQQLHLKKYEGMKVFRVLTVTETRGRAQSLEEEFRSMMSPAWIAAYPVIAFEDLALERFMPELVHKAES